MSVPISGVGNIDGPLTEDLLGGAYKTLMTQKDGDDHPIAGPERFELAVGSVRCELVAKRILLSQGAALAALAERTTIIVEPEFHTLDGWELRAA